MTSTETAPSGSEATSARPEAGPPRLYRSSSDRIVAGVCGGIAAHLGIESGIVRVLFAIAAIAGPGLPAYGFLWVFTHSDLTAPDGRPAQTPRRRLTPGQLMLAIGIIVVLVGVSWGGPLRALASHLGYVVPVVAVGAGVLIAWSQLDDSERGRWRGRSRGGKVLAVVRPVVGIGLLVVGVVAVFAQGRTLGDASVSALSAVAVLVGAVVIAAPWVVRMWRRLQREQTARIRATERADIAAHLHDSVLQTLALIQRRADDPAAVVRLARSQERELRAWLYADREQSGDSLAAAVTTVAHEVEDDHGVPIEVVVTGDRPLDPGGEALVKAAREAMLNAVRHGAPPVSTFVEVGPSGVECFVRDHGAGFELGEIGDDRLGVRESILGRMSRHGGAAKIRRLDSGTEVELSLPPLVVQPTEPQSAAPTASAEGTSV